MFDYLCSGRQAQPAHVWVSTPTCESEQSSSVRILIKSTSLDTIFAPNLKQAGFFHRIKSLKYNLIGYFCLIFVEEDSMLLHYSLTDVCDLLRKTIRENVFIKYSICFSKLWNAFILTVVLTNRVIFHHNTTIMFMQLPPIFYLIGAALDGILLFDVFVINFKMGYIDEEARRVVLNAGRGRIHYASTKLFLYVISAMPLQAIMLLRYGMSIQCYRCKANRFVSVIKLLGFIGLYRVFDASTYWSRERGTFKATYFFKFLRICILGFIFMLQFLNASEAVSILIIIENNEIYEKSYLAIMMQQRYWYNPPSAITYYCIEFSIISKSVFLFGYGLRPKLYYVDALLGMISFVCANVFYVWGLVECYAVINRLKYSEDQMNIHRDRSMNLMRCRRLSNKISAKLDKYYDFNMIKLVLIEKQNDLYHFLPSAQRREIRLTSYGRFIKRIPYFSDWPPKIIDGIVLLLKQEVFLEHDIVADVSTQFVSCTLLFMREE